MSDPANDVYEELRALRVAYATRLPAKLKLVEDAWQNLSQNLPPAENQAELIRKMLLAVHSLTGTSATYGFSQLSQVARELELVVKTWAAPLALSPEVEAATNHSIQRLQQEIAAIQARISTLDWNY